MPEDVTWGMSEGISPEEERTEENERRTEAGGRFGEKGLPRRLLLCRRVCALVSILLIFSQMDPSSVLRCFFYLEREEKVFGIFLGYLFGKRFCYLLSVLRFGIRNNQFSSCEIPCFFGLLT